MERPEVLALHARFRRRIQHFLFLESTLLAASFWCFLGGTGILIFRSVWGLAHPSMTWVLPGLVLAVLYGAWQSGQRLPDDGALLALLDHANQSGGLMLAAGEGPLGAWAPVLGRPVEPPLAWQGGRSLLMFVVALAYLLTGFLLPQKLVKPPGSRTLDLQAETEKLQERIDALKDEGMIDATQAEKMQEKLAALMKEATNEDPAKTYEALDHLEEMLAKVTGKALEKALEQNRKMVEAGTLAEGLLADPASASFDSRLGALQEHLQDLAEPGSGAVRPPGFDDPDMVTPLDGDVTPERIRQLLERIASQQIQLDAKLIKLGKVGLIDKKTFEALKKKADPGAANPGSTPDAGLIVFDEDNPGGGPASEAILIDLPGADGPPGSGGIDRGGGPAPLKFTGQTKEGGITFKDEALPPVKLPALEHSQTIGVGMSAPAVETTFAPVGGAGYADSPAGQAAAYAHRILPQHQPAVRRFFQREQGGN